MRGVRRVLFVGFAVSDDMFEHVLATDRGMPAQTQRFGWAVVDALREAGVETELISAEPVADFPNNRRLLVRGRRFGRGGTHGRSVTFVNLSGLKHVTRYVAAIRAERARRRDRFDAVLVHGVHSPFLWAALRIGARRRVPVVAIMTDPPSIRTHNDNRATLLMKRLDRTLIVRALRRMDGVVALSPGLADDFAPTVPCLWMEGIAPSGDDVPSGAGSRPPSVVYAGGLREEYGVIDLAEAAAIGRVPWVVTFYGRGPAAEALQDMARKSSRIEFGGTLPAEELALVYRNADLLVNPRRLEGFTNYSFPSKLLEYMASGTPVVTTRLPNLPSDYEPHLILSGVGPAELALSIDGALGTGRESLAELGHRAREFIVRTRGSRAQGQRLVTFLDGLAAEALTASSPPASEVDPE